jgi:hypothetical protein
MQAPRSLSKSQILALESCFLFLRTLRPFLFSLGNGRDEIFRTRIVEVVRFAELNEKRLIESFEEIADAASRWTKKLDGQS